MFREKCGLINLNPTLKTTFKDEYIFGCLCAPQSVTLGKSTVVFSQYTGNAATKCRHYRQPWDLVFAHPE